MKCFLQMYNIFPWIMEHLPGPHHKMFGHVDFLKEFTKTKIKEHKESLDPSSPRDYIDCFLIRMEQVGKTSFLIISTLALFFSFSFLFFLTLITGTLVCSQEKNLPTTEFHYKNLISTVMNLFLAGTETTSSTIRYALGVLIKHPHIQGRSHT